MMILLGYVFITVVTSIALSLIRKDYSYFKSLKLTLLNAYFIDSKPLLSLSLKFAVLLLSFELFMFFNKNFLGAGIKTSKVVVNTGGWTRFQREIFTQLDYNQLFLTDFLDEVVDSIFKLIHTRKTIGIGFQDTFLTNPPDHSLAQKLSKKKLQIIGHRMSEDVAEIVKNLPSFCFLSTELAIYYISSVFVQLSKPKKLVVFSETKSYHDTVSWYLIRRSLDNERKRFIHFR